MMKYILTLVLLQHGPDFNCVIFSCVPSSGPNQKFYSSPHLPDFFNTCSTESAVVARSRDVGCMAEKKVPSTSYDEQLGLNRSNYILGSRISLTFPLAHLKFKHHRIKLSFTIMNPVLITHLISSQKETQQFQPKYFPNSQTPSLMFSHFP